MKYSPGEFIARTRTAPYQDKREWIRSHIIGKDVLDLGVVDHDLDFCLNHRDQWLHGIITDHAASVVGVDILKEEVGELQRMGYNVLVADAQCVRLDMKFDVVVCGDLIEHVTNPGALLETIAFHLRDDGIGLVTTPNPFGISRFFNILADGWTGINTEHVSWFCPQTMFQLIERSPLFIDSFYWIETDYPMPTRRRFWGAIFNSIAPCIASKRQLMRNDYGIVLRKRPTLLNDRDTKNPFVSVIIPTCNRVRYLEGAIRSLLNQDYPTDSYEIIVVDNDSTSNNTIRQIDELAQGAHVNIKYIREDRHGLVFARHTGAALAKGDILLFGDDDALYDKNWVSAIVDVYLNYPEVGAVGTRIEIQWDRDPEPWVRIYEAVLGKLDYGNQVLVRKGLYINGGSFSIRKQILLQVQGFNPGQRGNYIVGDSETGLCRKLARAGIRVGWTPAATMWHLQQAEKHGTFGDLVRRFQNNGISDAYNATFNRWGLVKILKDIRCKSYRVFRTVLKLIRYRGKGPVRQKISLEIGWYSYYLKYLWLYRFDRTIRDEVLKRDWEFLLNYKVLSFPVTFKKNHNPALKENIGQITEHA